STTGHENDVFDAGGQAFLHGILDHRLVDNRQHLFRHGFRRGQKSRAETSNGEHSFSEALGLFGHELVRVRGFISVARLFCGGQSAGQLSYANISFCEARPVVTVCLQRKHAAWAFRQTPMSDELILGIESSCDETAAAVVAGGRRILSSVVASQVAIHRKYGGVVPELAPREHLRQIVPVVREAIEQAGITLHDVSAIAVTRGPGLIGALLVGVTYGKVLSYALGKPLIAVNHLEGHVHAVLLEAHIAGKLPELPAVCLIVSGGDTILYHVKTESASGNAASHFTYTRIGGTRDDAAGEAYDKVAKMLSLGYPGGPVIDHLAAHGDATKIQFGGPKMKGNPFDFSFSGIKTAVLYHLRRNPQLQPEIESRQAALRGER